MPVGTSICFQSFLASVFLAACRRDLAGGYATVFGSCGQGGLGISPSSGDCKGEFEAVPFPLYGNDVNPCSSVPRYSADPLLQSPGSQLSPTGVNRVAASVAHTVVISNGRFAVLCCKGWCGSPLVLTASRGPFQTMATGAAFENDHHKCVSLCAVLCLGAVVTCWLVQAWCTPSATVRCLDGRVIRRPRLQLHR